MNCLNPVKIELNDETRAKRMEKLYMPLEYRFATHVYVPCGKCEACMSRKRSQWSLRLHNEVADSISCYFITLTYDDEFIKYDNNGRPKVCKEDVQLFLKRLRKQIHPFKIRYFLVSEYGPKTMRPHYHMLLFNFPHELDRNLDAIIESSWSNGFIRVDPVNSARIHYVTSYCLDTSTLPEEFVKNFMLCSRKPGIGSGYLDQDSSISYHLSTNDDFCYIPSNGKVVKVKMPRFYSDKIFPEESRDQISLKNTQYVDQERKKLIERHRQWLIKNHYDVNKTTLKTAYDGSPLKNAIDFRNDFVAKVRAKCKNKHNG